MRTERNKTSKSITIALVLVVPFYSDDALPPTVTGIIMKSSSRRHRRMGLYFIVYTLNVNAYAKKERNCMSNSCDDK